MTIVQWLLLPAFVHVAWVYVIAFRMGAAKQRDLREGLEMVEEKARAELGMVKPNEIFVQVAK